MSSRPRLASLCLVTSVVLGGVVGGGFLSMPAQAAGESPPAEAASEISLVPDGEPGEALVIRGRVYDSEGGEPLSGVAVFAYQADRGGYYNREGENSAENARLAGWLRTDAEGRFEIRTIRPGSYPDSRIPAHIHFRLVSPEGGEKTDLLQFTGDPFLRPGAVKRAEQEGRFGRVRPIETAPGGLLLCQRDFRLDG